MCLGLSDAFAQGQVRVDEPKTGGAGRGCLDDGAGRTEVYSSTVLKARPSPAGPRVEASYSPSSLLPSYQLLSLAFDTCPTPSTQPIAMLLARLSLVALASTLIGTVAAELKIIAPGGPTLWWGE